MLVGTPQPPLWAAAPPHLGELAARRPPQGGLTEGATRRLTDDCLTATVFPGSAYIGAAIVRLIILNLIATVHSFISGSSRFWQSKQSKRKDSPLLPSLPFSALFPYEIDFPGKRFSVFFMRSIVFKIYLRNYLWKWIYFTYLVFSTTSFLFLPVFMTWDIACRDY